MFFRFLTYNKFKDKHWLNLSYNQRLITFQKLENIQAKKLHRSPCTVIPVNLDDNVAGFFESKTNRIYINENFLIYDNLRFLGMNTLFHEGRHAFQYLCCFQKNKYLFPFSYARKWKKNFQGYANGEKEPISFYTMQPVERDANKYALNRLKQFRSKFKENEIYENTLKLIEHEYIDDKITAKKELGAFYQIKVAYNNKKKRNRNLN